MVPKEIVEFGPSKYSQCNQMTSPKLARDRTSTALKWSEFFQKKSEAQGLNVTPHASGSGKTAIIGYLFTSHLQLNCHKVLLAYIF